MNIALLTIAFGAGISVFFSPCGVALLPSYIALLLSKKETHNQSKLRRAWQGFKIGFVVSLGIVTVFLGLGILISFVGNILAPYAFWFGTITGILLIILGVFMLAGKSLHLAGLKVRLSEKLSFKTYYIFGIVYAFGGIACTLGVFLFVVGTALSSGDFLTAFLTFLSFTAGAVILMVSVTVLSAITKTLANRWIARYLRPVQIISSLIVIIGGLYLIGFNMRAFLL